MSGGSASHLVDLCGAAGVPVPRLEERTIEELHRHIPAYLHVANPVDTGGAIVMTPAGRAVLEAMLDDTNTSIVLAPITGVFPGMSDSVANDVIALHEQQRKPILVTWSSPIRDDTYRRLCDAGVPVFHSFGATVRGAQALLAHHELVTDYESPVTTPPVVVSPTPRRITDGDAIDEVSTKRVLAEFGVPVVDEIVATDADEAAAAAEHFDRPVAMKILSPDISHKSDLGLVSLHVTSADAARVEYERIVTTAADAAPDAQVSGVVVAPMVTDGVCEVILGVSRQAPFGPTIMFGLGGVMVEVFRDVTFGVPPFTRAYARRMVLDTVGAKLLLGFRGRPPGDVDALVDAIMALQRLVLEAGDDVEELDVNPVVVRPEGLGVVAVDALLVLRTSSED
jgi:acyl-CoA synthetase (NDP forming)